MDIALIEFVEKRGQRKEDLRMIELTDYPKLHCPFVRKTYEVNQDDWRKHGRKLQLRKPEVYLVTPEINPGYEWVFDDPDTIAVEKLDGTNVKLLIDHSTSMRGVL
jgi:hypothetical protein